jgi:hypothetical protein
MKKTIMIFAALMMSSLIQTAAHAEWIDARVTSINNTNQTMQVQHKTSTGLSETMTVNLDKNISLDGYQGIGDVKTGDRVRLDIESSSFRGAKTVRSINASLNEQSDLSFDSQQRSGVAGSMNRGLDSRLSAGASARSNEAGLTDLPAGSRAVSDVNAPTNNNPPKALTSSNSLAGSNNSAGNTDANIRAEGAGGVNSPSAAMNTGGSI